MRVHNDVLVDARRTRTRKEPKQQSNKCSQKSKEKEKGKTQKKTSFSFSQEILSSKRISKELKSKQQVPNYETPPLKQPRVICWGPEAYVGVRNETPVNWGLEGCGANKQDEGSTFVVDIAEGIIESPPEQVEVPPSMVKGWREGEGNVIGRGDVDDMGEQGS
jgi:hypothetical protein